MDFIDDQYQLLDDLPVETSLSSLHQAGYVYGNIQTASAIPQGGAFPSHHRLRGFKHIRAYLPIE
jgi:hypothetical protein